MKTNLELIVEIRTNLEELVNRGNKAFLPPLEFVKYEEIRVQMLKDFADVLQKSSED